MKLKVATIWLDGCSGCHMSFLDMDERIIALSEQIEVVYSPYVDTKLKDMPNDIDLALVEGAVSSEEDREKIHLIRKNSKFIIAFGDCAITGNVSAMRNPFGPKSILEHAYKELTSEGEFPEIEVPKLLENATPVHEWVHVDLHLPGCPPPADAIYTVLSDLLAGKTPDVSALTRFGK